jgi:hypothetical protein
MFCERCGEPASHTIEWLEPMGETYSESFCFECLIWVLANSVKPNDELTVVPCVPDEENMALRFACSC